MEAHFSGVSLGALVSGAGGSQTWAHDLELSVGDSGITVGGAEGAQASTLPWSAVRQFAPGFTLSFPDGKPATELEVALADRSLNFLVPAEQLPPALVAELMHLAPAPSPYAGVPSAVPPPPPPGMPTSPAQTPVSGGTPGLGRDPGLGRGSRPPRRSVPRVRDGTDHDRGHARKQVGPAETQARPGGRPGRSRRGRSRGCRRSRRARRFFFQVGRQHDHDPCAAQADDSQDLPGPGSRALGPSGLHDPPTRLRLPFSFATQTFTAGRTKVAQVPSTRGSLRRRPSSRRETRSFLLSPNLLEPSFGVLQQCSNLPLDHLQLLTGNYYAGGPPTWNSAVYTPLNTSPGQLNVTPQLFSTASEVATPRDQESDFAAMAAPTYSSCLTSFFSSYLRAFFGQEGGTVDDLVVKQDPVPKVAGVETLGFELNAQLVAQGDVFSFRGRFIFMGAGRLELFLSGYDSPDKAIPSRTWNVLLSTLQHRMETTAGKTGKPVKTAKTTKK